MRIVLLPLLVFLSIYSNAQYIREDDIHFKQTLVRSIPLKQENNESIFGNKLVSVLLNAYKCNRITGFKNATCTDTLSIPDFYNRFISEGDSSFDTFTYVCTRIELTEHLIVDKHKSDIMFTPVSLTLMLPPSASSKGLLEPLVSFKFEECTAIFKNDQRAYAINPLKNGRNINFAEVFMLKLYSSYIVKIGNEEELYFDQQGKDVQSTFLLTKHEEDKLTEYLYTLFNPK